MACKLAQDFLTTTAVKAFILSRIDQSYWQGAERAVT